MTRSSRAHARTVAQEQEPLPGHAKSAAKGARSHAGKSTKPAKASAHASSPKASAKAHTKGRKHQQDDADEDAPLMHRAAAAHGRHGKPQREIAAVAPRRGRQIVHEVAARTPAPRTRESAPAPIERAAAASPASALTANDFYRAARGEANPEGVSHPDEMNDDLPVAVGTAQRPEHATVAAASPSTPAPAALASTRVDGFGAEGVAAPNHRTLARTMAAHRNDARVTRTTEPPHFTPAEENEITDEAVKPMVLPAVYRGGRLVMPAPLKGSHEVLVHQNLMADHDGLDRIQDQDQLEDLMAQRQLVRLPESASLHLNPELPEDRRYARPWTVKFAADTARAFNAKFGTPIQINSAVRTVAVQLHLMRVNGNAANIDGDTASPHLTGQAIDIGKRGMSKAELAWMRNYLLPLMEAGKIDVEEEFQQACFHVSVYRSYAPKRHVEVAANTRAAARVPAAEASDAGEP